MSELEDSIKRGLEQSARREVYDLGDFSKYVDEREELIDLIVHFTGKSDVDATEIADAIMSAGWMTTEEHMAIIADSARYGGAVNRSLQERLDKAEANAAEYKGKWTRTWELAQNRAKEIFKLQRELAEVQAEVRCLRAGGEY